MNREIVLFVVTKMCFLKTKPGWMQKCLIAYSLFLKISESSETQCDCGGGTVHRVECFRQLKWLLLQNIKSSINICNIPMSNTQHVDQ